MGGQVQTGEGKTPPVPLEYATPASEVRPVIPADVYATRVTLGVAVGILVSALALLLDPDGGPSSGMCLFSSPIALFYTQFTGKTGGRFPHERRATIRRFEKQLAFIIGFLLPTLNVAVGASLDRFGIEGKPATVIGIARFISLVLGPFLSVSWLVRRSALRGNPSTEVPDQPGEHKQSNDPE